MAESRRIVNPFHLVLVGIILMLIVSLVWIRGFASQSKLVVITQIVDSKNRFNDDQIIDLSLAIKDLQKSIEKLKIKSIVEFQGKSLCIHQQQQHQNRSSPDFIIAGAQKSGTTTLKENLKEAYPGVVYLPKKEIHFFDSHFEMGIEWYASKLEEHHMESFVGEKSPRYLFDSTVPKRIAKLAPNCKIILMLRNPVDRAYSAYKMNYLWGETHQSFEKQILAEIKLLKENNVFSIRKENKNMNNYDSRYDDMRFEKDAHIWENVYSVFKNKIDNSTPLEDKINGAGGERIKPLISRGLYSLQIKNMLRYIPSCQILIISTDEYEKHRIPVLRRIMAFLATRNNNSSSLQTLIEEVFPMKKSISLLTANKGSRVQRRKWKLTSSNSDDNNDEREFPGFMNNQTKSLLQEFFAPWNEDLFVLLGKRFPWQ